MEKVIRIALQNQYGSNAEDVLKLIMATQDPEIATQMALGIYEQPIISQQADDRKEQVNRTFLSFNPLTQDVVYTYNRVKVKEGWALKYDESNEVITTTYWADDAATELGIDEKEFKDTFHKVVYERDVDLKHTFTDRMCLERWESESSN